MTSAAGAGNPPDLVVKVVMLFGGALASLAIVAIGPVLPAIDTALAKSPGDSLLVKQLVGIVGAAMMVGSVLAGFLIRRLPVGGIITAAAAIYILAGTAGLYLSDLTYLLASRFVLGLAAATIQIIALTLINTRLDGARRAHWMGLHIFTALACTIAINPISGAIGDLNWRYPFALYGLGVLMFPAALFYRDPEALVRKDAAPTEATSWLDLWRGFPFHYLPLAILIGSIVFLPAIYVPFILRDRGISNPSTIALILMADAIAGAAASSQYGRARRYVSRHGAYALAFGIAALGMLVAGLSPTLYGVVPGMLIYGLATGWFVPNLMTSVGERVTADRQSRTIGIVKAAHFSSSGVALLIMEPLTRAYGSQAGLLVISAAAAALTVMALVRLRFSSAARPHAV